MRSPLGYPPLLGPAQSNDRRASGGGLARLIESSRDVMTSEIGTFQKCRSFRRRSAMSGKAFDPVEFSKRCEGIVREQIERYRTINETAGTA
jgi:hypothetical protein